MIVINSPSTGSFLATFIHIKLFMMHEIKDFTGVIVGDLILT